MTKQKLTRQQILWVEKFQDYWGQFLTQICGAFIGPPTADRITDTVAIVDRIQDKIFETARTECRGLLGQNSLVMLFGSIAGDQFGRHCEETGVEVDDSFPTEAAQMFEAAFRVAYERYMAERGDKDKPKILGPEGEVLA